VLYDMYKGQDRIKFILTGSAHLNLHRLTAESLAGRVELLHLREFNLHEIALLQHCSLVLPTDDTLSVLFRATHTSERYLQELHEIHASLSPFHSVLDKALEDALVWGGLPETIEEPSEQARLRYLGNYLQIV
jgi:uncharacterized protein